MAVYKIFPQKDTFISSDIPLGNAGNDEILEIKGYPDTSGVGQTSRVLIKYDTAEIKDVISTKIGENSYTASLKLYLADAYELPTDLVIEAYPIYTTTGWDNGTGKYGDIPTNKTGASWKYKQGGETNQWIVSTFPTYVTGSYPNNNTGGGNWYTASAGTDLKFTQSFTQHSDLDIDIDVTQAINLFNSDTIVNEGFILKLPTELEFNTTSSINLKYFGVDTNTIYPPCLEFRWDDSTYETGSLSVLTADNNIVEVLNNKGKYTDEGNQRFRLTAKPKYPVRTFSTSSIYLTNYALPSASYWGIKDEYTEEMVVDFDNISTKISCDATGPYFNVYMGGLQPERYYRILVKTTLDGSTVVIDTQSIFKVVRNG